MMKIIWKSNWNHLPFGGGGGRSNRLEVYKNPVTGYVCKLNLKWSIILCNWYLQQPFYLITNGIQKRQNFHFQNIEIPAVNHALVGI